MKTYLTLGFKHLLALHVSLAYLSMLTGFGMLLFTASFFYLLAHPCLLDSLTDVIGLLVFFHWMLTYLMAVIGSGAIILSIAFYQKMYHKV